MCLILGTSRFVPLICSYHSVLPATVCVASVTSTDFAMWKELYVHKNTVVDFRTDYDLLVQTEVLCAERVVYWEAGLQLKQSVSVDGQRKPWCFHTGLFAACCYFPSNLSLSITIDICEHKWSKEKCLFQSSALCSCECPSQKNIS